MHQHQLIGASRFLNSDVVGHARIHLHQAMKQALWFPEHANPEVSLILFHYLYSQYKYRNIFKETSDVQIILTYCIVVDLLHNPNNPVLIFTLKPNAYIIKYDQDINFIIACLPLEYILTEKNTICISPTIQILCFLIYLSFYLLKPIYSKSIVK